MDFFSKVFNYKNSINCPKVTEDYLESIGVKEKFIWYYGPKGDCPWRADAAA